MIVILHRSQVLQLRTIQINQTSSKAVLVALPARSSDFSLAWQLQFKQIVQDGATSCLLISLIKCLYFLVKQIATTLQVLRKTTYFFQFFNIFNVIFIKFQNKKDNFKFFEIAVSNIIILRPKMFLLKIYIQLVPIAINIPHVCLSIYLQRLSQAMSTLISLRL